MKLIVCIPSRGLIHSRTLGAVFECLRQTRSSLSLMANWFSSDLLSEIVGWFASVPQERRKSLARAVLEVCIVRSRIGGSFRGKKWRESSHSTNKPKAKQPLSQRLAEM